MNTGVASGFLADAAVASRRRLTRSRRNCSTAILLTEIATLPAAPALYRDESGFDVIAEYKKRSPSVGDLAVRNLDVATQVAAYATGGAAAVSILCEPDFFAGSIDDLHIAAKVLNDFHVPVMCKDFLIDPYQVIEARAAGAGGVLLIARILDDVLLSEMIATATSFDLFVLVECFDKTDIERVSAYTSNPNVLIGINSRDLVSFKVDVERFEQFAPARYGPAVNVAESGIESADRLRTVADFGYEFALLGACLMNSSAPAIQLQNWLHAARRTISNADRGLKKSIRA